jgi:UDP-N-acetylmuramoyl-L-alanyl-D-glutamate--2,6-diaminopimelate ligase
MKLSGLISALDHPKVKGNLNCEVAGLTHDSRSVAPGLMFVAIHGLHQDGHQFVNQAMDQGAVAVVVEKQGLWGKIETSSCVIQVQDTRKALSRLAHEFYGKPSHRMGMIGVTGTNGKTTTTYLIRGILEAAGKKVGLMGTTGYHLGREAFPASHTTPESLDLHQFLARMVQSGVQYAVMEVSSHALSMGRVSDCAFDVAVYTNITQDHLDFHKDMEDYFKAKQKLFSGLGKSNPKSFPRRAVVNGDDPRASQVIEVTQVPRWTYSIDKQADLMAEDIQIDFGGIHFSAITPEGKFEIQSPLTGRYNVYNILAAIGVALSQDIPIPIIQTGIKNIQQIPGRFEKIQQGQDFLVIVDYAHSEDALRKLLLAVQELRGSALSREGRVLTVFGCGGDRDRGKRPKMGQVAMEMSDLVVLTSDNPRTEDPMAIIREIEAGINQWVTANGRSAEYWVIPDRAEAIQKTIGAARRGDIVVIAGKGHEDYQIVGLRKFHCDDREMARDAIRKLNLEAKRIIDSH